MSLDVQIDGGPRVVVSGELDMATSPELTSAIESLERTEAQRVVLDLSGVTFIDSTALSALCLAKAKLNESTRRARARPGVSAGRDGAADLRTPTGVHPRDALTLS